jgi:hypothetical protein
MHSSTHLKYQYMEIRYGIELAQQVKALNGIAKTDRELSNKRFELATQAEKLKDLAASSSILDNVIRLIERVTARMKDLLVISDYVSFLIFIHRANA